MTSNNVNDNSIQPKITINRSVSPEIFPKDSPTPEIHSNSSFNGEEDIALPVLLEQMKEDKQTIFSLKRKIFHMKSNLVELNAKYNSLHYEFGTIVMQKQNIANKLDKALHKKRMYKKNGDKWSDTIRSVREVGEMFGFNLGSI